MADKLFILDSFIYLNAMFVPVDYQHLIYNNEYCIYRNRFKDFSTVYWIAVSAAADIKTDI